MEEKIYTVEQVAKRFMVDPKTVRVWLRSGELKYFKIAGNVRITEESIQKLIEDSSKNKKD